MRSLISLAFVAALFGCTKRSEKYCLDPLNSNDPRCLTDSGPEETCDADHPCSDGICLDGLCVQCTADDVSRCTGDTPICNTTSHDCVGCDSHDDCPMSDACLPTGSCANASDIAYVEAGGTGNCDQEMPCGLLTTALATTKATIKMKGAIIESDTVTIDSNARVILADPATSLDTSKNSVPVLQVSGTSNVEIYDLLITGSSGSNAPGLRVVNGANVTLVRAKLSVNDGGFGAIVDTAGMFKAIQSEISGNKYGGMRIINTQFEIVNTAIINNGGLSGLIGGLNLLDLPSTGTFKIEFSTIARNQGSSGAPNGINCSTVNPPAKTFTNNIIWDNTGTGSPGGEQVGGANCTASFSTIGPQPFTGGPGNIADDPKFANLASGDYHLMMVSPARDTADPAATLGVDFEGDARPEGAARDMGADEFTP